MTAARPLAPALLLIGLAIILLATAGGHLYSPDEEVMFRVTESLTRGRLAVEPMAMDFGTKTGRDGNEYAQYGLGNSIAAIPFHALGSVVARVWPHGELAEILSTGSLVNAGRYQYSENIDCARRFAVAHLNIVITLLQVWVLFLFACELTGRASHAVLVGALYALATQAWPHAKTFFSEPLATLCLTAGAYHLWTGMRRASIPRLWLAGGLLGFAHLTRLDSVLAMPGLGLLFLMSLLRGEVDQESESQEPIRSVRPLSAILAVGVPLTLFLMAILSLNWWRWGSLMETGYVDQAEGFRFDTSLAESLPGLLLSPGRSIFVYSPPILLGLLGLPLLLRRERPLGVGVLTAILVTLLVHCLWQNWSGGWDWGPRHVFSLIAWSMIPLAALLGSGSFLSQRTALALCALVGIVGFGVQVIGISQSPIEFYDIGIRPHVVGNELRPPRFAVIAAERGEIMPDGNDQMWIRDYLPWRGYPEMWRAGIHDLFWLRWWQWRSREADR